VRCDEPEIERAPGRDQLLATAAKGVRNSRDFPEFLGVIDNRPASLEGIHVDAFPIEGELGGLRRMDSGVEVVVRICNFLQVLLKTRLQRQAQSTVKRKAPSGELAWVPMGTVWGRLCAFQPAQLAILHGVATAGRLAVVTANSSATACNHPA